MSNFDLLTLPDDIITIVFNEYSLVRDKIAIGLVCRRFRHLLNWNKTSLKLRIKGNDTYIDNYNIPVVKWPTLVSILLEKTKNITTELTCEKVDFRYMEIRFLDMLQKHQESLKLTYLKLNHCGDMLSDWFLQWGHILANLNSLTLIDTKVDLNNLRNVLSNKSIKYLTLYDDSRFSYVSTENLGSLVNNLELEHFHYNGPWRNMDSVGSFFNFIYDTAQLKSLIIEGISLDRERLEQILPSIWQACPTLESFSKQCWLPTQKTVGRVFQSFFSSIPKDRKVSLKLPHSYMLPCAKDKILQTLRQTEPSAKISEYHSFNCTDYVIRCGLSQIQIGRQACGEWILSEKCEICKVDYGLLLEKMAYRQV